MIKRFLTMSVCVFIYLVAVHSLCFSAGSVVITPAPKGLAWKDFNIEIKNDWKITVSNQERVVEIAEYLKDEISDKTGISIGIQRNPVVGSGKSVMLFLTAEKAAEDLLKAKNSSLPAELCKEGYFLEVFDDCVLIVSEDPAGIFYGVQTLLQMIDTKNAGTVLSAAKIIDFPNVKLRGVHILDPDPDKLKEEFDLMAKLKMNFAVISSWKLFELDEGDNAQKFQDVFAYARKLFIEPVPELAAFGQGGPVLTKEPYAAEGIWIEDEFFEFVDNGKAVPISGSKSNLVNLIRAEDSNITITSLDKTNIYREGIDYEVSDGETAYPFLPSNKPAEILRIPSGAIKEKQKVLVSYDYVENKCLKWAPWSVPYCPSSELTHRFMFKSLENVVTLLQPKYIGIGGDEIRGMNRDSRCKKRGMTNAELLSEEINKLDNFVKSLNPDIRLMMWDDMINPWHNGGDDNYQVQFGGPSGKTSAAIESIPKDIIIMVWWYDADDWLSKMKNSPAYFESKGFDYLGAAYKDKKNIKDWSNLIKDRPLCMGLITTTWDGWNKNLEGITYTAEAGWN